MNENNTTNNTINIEEKRREEQSTVVMMIQIYCRRNHRQQWKTVKDRKKRKTFLCPECQELADYAVMRSQKCPYLAKGTKTFCSSCKTHCYKPEYREQIRAVMRFSGPRMIFKIPSLCIKHIFRG